MGETAPEMIERIAREWAPDLLLCWLPEVYPPPLGIEDAPVRTVALISDWNVFYPILALNLSRYDLTLCDKHGVGVFRSDYVSPHYLFPLYSQVTPFHRPYGGEKDIDVVFVGNLNHAAHRTRAHYLERLAKLSDRYRIVITADVRGEAYGRLLSRSRVVFNHSIRGEVNLRVLETMACGSLAFLEENNREVRDWFDVDAELVLYNAENFEKRLVHYLEHREEAEAVTARGHARAAEFAGENRLTRLIEWAAEQACGARRFHDLPAEEREYQDLRMYGRSPSAVYRSLELRLLSKLMQEWPDDPRVLTAAGCYLLAPEADAEQQHVRCVKSFAKACECAGDSAPYALNAATALRAFGMTDGEATYLKKALDATDLEGADLLIGHGGDAFYVQWQLAVAEKTATCAALHAEALIRLAAIHTGRGDHVSAEAELVRAGELDATAVRRLPMLAELYWATGRQVEAVDTLRRALPDLPMDVAVRQRLCDMLVALGAKSEAKALAEESLAITRACQDPPIM